MLSRTLTVSCVILGHKDFVENDRLIYLYTEELGKIKVVAKGARKITSKFTGHLETLNFAMAEIYHGPKNIILKEIITIKNFKKIRENYQKLSAALQIAGISNQLLYENQKIENLISLLETTLRRLSNSNKALLIAQSYIIKLLDLAGMIPDFKTINTSLEEKYLKFFHFLKTRSLDEIHKINISKNEENIISQFMEKIIAYST